MDYKVIKDYYNLSLEELEILAVSFQTGGYEIILSKPEKDNIPKGIADCFTTKDTYQFMLADPNATFAIFSFKCRLNDDFLILPLGVFGISPLHRIYFPLLINELGRGFLILSLKDFNDITGLQDEDNSKYLKLLKIRKEFIEKVFAFYYFHSTEYNSIMGWPAKKKNSLTSSAAEALNFIRLELGNGNDTDIYVKVKLTEPEFNNLMKCGERQWDIYNRTKDTNVKSVSANNDQPLRLEQTVAFYKKLLE